MLSIAEHRACIDSFCTRLRFCYDGKKISHIQQRDTKKNIYFMYCKYCTGFGFIILFCKLAFCKVQIC